MNHQDSNNDPQVEERLFYDFRRRNDLNEVFWCHMGRYIFARSIASAHAKAQGRPLRVLDAASGTGYGTYFLSHGGHNCTGIDLDPEAVSFSRAVYGRPCCSFQQGTVLELPFESNTFDLIVSFETIEHLAHEQQRAFIEEIVRVTKPNGQIVISAPVQQGGMDSPSHNQFHLHEPDPVELLDLMQQRFTHVHSLGQLIRTKRASLNYDARPLNNASTSFDASRPSTLRQIRSVARLATNTVFERYYLRHTWILHSVMSALYTGYFVEPLDWESNSATFMILHAATPRC